MPTTSKMGIVYPSSSDLVKDGATAMGTISTTVDNKTGLIFLSTTSFTSVASVSLPASTFTTTYDMYRIMIDLTAVTASGILGLRMRSGSTDETSTNYITMGQSITQTGGAAAFATTTGTSYQIINLYSALGDHKYSAQIDLMRPATAVNTIGARVGTGIATAGSTYEGYTGGLLLTTSTAYDSATLINSGGGNLTGKIQVYGYNQ
jgi:hypothetical protein